MFFEQRADWSFWPALMKALHPALCNARLSLYVTPPGMKGMVAFGRSWMPSISAFERLLAALLLLLSLLSLVTSLWKGRTAKRFVGHWSLERSSLGTYSRAIFSNFSRSWPLSSYVLIVKSISFLSWVLDEQMRDARQISPLKVAVWMLGS